MKRLVSLAVGSVALAAFAFTQHATSSATMQIPAGQLMTTAPGMPTPMPAPMMATPMPTLTPIPITTANPLGPIATPMPANTMLP